jgi:serine/threonine protein kinase
VSALLEQLKGALGSQYRIERELGGGGMSRVFLAEEVALGRRVVLKVLPAELGAVLSADRFQREVRLAASLQHPHIVTLLSAGRAGDALYYTMP